MRKQATKANQAQIHQHIERQRKGIPGMEFAQVHPILDAIGGAALLAFAGWAFFQAFITTGAGV